MILYCPGCFPWLLIIILKKQNNILPFLHMCVHVQEYEEEHSKLVAVVTSMEQNIKALLKDFDSKKKVNFLC